MPSAAAAHFHNQAVRARRCARAFCSDPLESNILTALADIYEAREDRAVDYLRALRADTPAGTFPTPPFTPSGDFQLSETLTIRRPVKVSRTIAGVAIPPIPQTGTGRAPV